ncbi:hypothetical protein EV356DRAFT_21139 [Viridothelium virens]|uniref:Zn(2)-C6 fungal-type domain-containing protein n=1 Tax=Viridothelium virens TaxID=1048519 RepID=A0A6A6GV15_VIRVR|nr:hypothetical protein EV356DRAFT_21139 [Viridothelium virens]
MDVPEESTGRHYPPTLDVPADESGIAPEDLPQMRDGTTLTMKPLQNETPPPSDASGKQTPHAKANESYAVENFHDTMHDQSLPQQFYSNDELDAFLDFENENNATDFVEHCSEKPIVRVYDLRPGPREDPENVWTTWHDEDESGNYDPNAKVPERQVVKRKRVREEVFQEIKSLEEGPEKRAKINSLLVARQEGQSYVVSLAFPSSRAKKELRRYRGQDNWPEESWNHLALPDPDRISDEEKPTFLNTSGSYKLRSHYKDDPSLLPFREASPIKEDLTGHPAARGCVACYKLGDTCSLLKEPRQYPCELCKADDLVCDLITPPKWKRSCEACRKKKVKCSYYLNPYDEDEHRVPCVTCSEAGYHCVAGPRVDDPTDPPLRIDLDYDWSAKRPEKTRRFVACTFCRSNKKRCSLFRCRDDLPCKACKDAGLECTFEALETSKQSGTQQSSVAGASSSFHLSNTEALRPGAPIPHWSLIPDESSPPSPAINSHSSSSTFQADADPTTDDGTFQINTAFAHPLTFNHLTTPQLPCHFCGPASTRFAILGYGMRSVTVVEWVPGKGYDEIGGGHRGEGKESTRMCLKCTMARVRICACGEHEIKSLKGILADPLEAMEALTEGDGQDADKYQWCNVCPNVALYECVTSQERNEFGELIHPKAREQLGCGLLLCDACAMAVVAKEGNLQAMLMEGPKADGEEETEGDVEMEDRAESGRYPLGWRADAEFLRADGLMMEAVLADD